jgi:hypothetical protein
MLLAGLSSCGDNVSSERDARPADGVDAALQVDAAPVAPACDDGRDNDGDDLIDGWDPECTASFDASEDSFALGLVDECEHDTAGECRFDSNTGGGDDATCAAATVPGCDCWGCCTMCDDQSCTTALMDPCRAPDCRFDVFANRDVCPVCEPDPACGASCDAASCVLCPGQDAGDLADDCDGQPRCSGDAPTCGADRVCPAGRWCSHGCCIAGQGRAARSASVRSSQFL